MSARWTITRKLTVVSKLVNNGYNKEMEMEVLQKYPDLSQEELHSWVDRYHRHGRKGLLLKNLRTVRQ